MRKTATSKNPMKIVYPLAHFLPAAAFAIPFACSTASGAVLFSDNFNRADSYNIQAAGAVIQNNTGSALAGGAPGTIYSQPHLDPNNRAPGYAAPNTDPVDGGGARILSNTLQLAAQQPGTSNAYVNHNFTNASILDAGGFSVSLDVTAYDGTGIQQGGAFALGMSQTEAASARDAFDLTAPKMTGAFHDTSTINAIVGGNVISDFWIALRGNGSLAWGGGTGSTINGMGSVGRTGTIRVDFYMNSFALGSSVNYHVFLNSVERGSGTFAWSEANQNYIGLDARSGPGTSFDNFSVNTVPEVSSVMLALVAAPGLLRRRR